MTTLPTHTIDPKNIRAKKRWGQNFLTDANIRRKILDCASVNAGEQIVEIGPGKGFLTEGLLERGAKVTAIEIDPVLVQVIQSKMDASLHEQQSRFKNLRLIQADALRYDYQTLSAPYKVVANLPYYISTPLLFRLLEERQHVRQMVLMLQKEVAERLSASVGSKSYGSLSLVIQFYADVKIAFTVSPQCFQPKPKVSSAVVSITPLETPRIQVRDEPLFLKVVKGAFLYRRKRISNALRFAGFPEPWIKETLHMTGQSGERRGETFTMAEFADLSNAFFEVKHKSRSGTHVPD